MQVRFEIYSGLKSSNKQRIQNKNFLLNDNATIETLNENADAGGAIALSINQGKLN